MPSASDEQSISNNAVVDRVLEDPTAARRAARALLDDESSSASNHAHALWALGRGALENNKLGDAQRLLEGLGAGVHDLAGVEEH